jgi:hypothetical protein
LAKLQPPPPAPAPAEPAPEPDEAKVLDFATRKAAIGLKVRAKLSAAEKTGTDD